MLRLVLMLRIITGSRVQRKTLNRLQEFYEYVKRLVGEVKER